MEFVKQELPTSLKIKKRTFAPKIYNELPKSLQLPMDVLGESGLERLRMLQKFDDISPTTTLFSKEYFCEVDEITKKLPFYNIMNGMSEKTVFEDYDTITFYLLLLVHQDNEDRRHWLISNEVKLFLFRLFLHGPTKSIEKFRFLKSNDSGRCVELLKAKEEFQIMNKIKEKYENQKSILSETISDDVPHLIRVEWQNFPQLMQKHRLIQIENHFYGNMSQFLPIMGGIYRIFFYRKMTELILKRSHMEISNEFELLLKFLKNDGTMLPMQIGNNSDLTNEITANNIDMMARSFPPCMRRHYEHLREKNILKYSSRLEYVRFLYGCSMRVHETTNYWRREFCKNGKMDSKTFSAKYEYSIRHVYGLEGKKQTRNGYTCLQLITQENNVNNQDTVHGCPFATEQDDRLRQMLFKYNPNSQLTDIEEVMTTLGTKHHCQMACQRYLEIETKEKLPKNLFNIGD
ncbi:hypothetical protein SNEBB_007010 [Seison nebaliae]|nr:hypothetical protein SNEBB_007010 [Seison nebaliae]